MSVKRSIALTGAGAVSSAAALVASPGTYAWLRRRLGLERGQDHYEVEAEHAAPHAEESLAEARLSLRARLAEAAAPARVQASGGIRSVADAEELLAAGAARVVVGTAVWADASALARYADALGEQLVVAIDVRAGRLAVRGWAEEAACSPEAAAVRCLDAGVARCLCTAIERDGTLAGPDLALLRRIRSAAALPVLAAGGIARTRDLDLLAAAGCEGAIVGRALLEGSIPLSVLAA